MTAQKSMPAPKRAPKRRTFLTATKDYYHLIPQSILHRYCVEPSNSSGPKKAHRKDLSHEELSAKAVLYYDIPSLTLSNQPVSKVYGVQDLYRDVSAQHTDELEKGLFSLENHATMIIDDLYLHKHDEFTLNRKDLYSLWKFLYVVHYRQSKLSNSYFHEEHPENRLLVPWLRNFKKKHGLETAADIWIFTIRYYMDTPHSAICEDAEEMYRKYERDEVARGVIDPNMEHYIALAYATQAQDYFLGFWEAPEGTEFILGNNSFGLGEGSMMHLIFVVGPRFAIVLRHNKMLPGNLRQPCLSTDFENIRQEPPRLTSVDWAAESEADIFAFQITQLTKAQMQALNSLILSNVGVNGSITFSSKEYILGVIRAHCVSLDNLSDRPRYHPLIDALSSQVSSSVLPAKFLSPASRVKFYAMIYNFSNTGWMSLAVYGHSYAIPRQGDTPSIQNGSLAQYRAIVEMSFLKVLEQPISRPFPRTFTLQSGGSSGNPRRRSTEAANGHSVASDHPDNEFRRVLNGVMDGSLTFRSRYDKAHRIFSMCNMDIHETNPFAAEVHRLTRFCIVNFAHDSEPPEDFSSKPHAEIIESMSTRQSTSFFKLIDGLMDRMGVEPGAITLSRYLSDVVALQFLLWIVQNRHDTLLTVLPNIDVMK